MKVRSLKLQDVRFGNQWFDEVEDHWDYADMKADPKWRTGWISVDCAAYDDRDDRVYLGITSFDADIFKAYDRRKGQFVDLGYRRIADPFDAKFHRALLKGPDGCIYGAIALLHDADRYFDASGGAIVKYDPVSGSLTKLGIPLPHVYIQSAVLSGEKLYCLCFAPTRLASFDLRTGLSRDLGPICGWTFPMPESLAVDDAGFVWSSWSLTRAWQDEAGADAIRLCRVDPARDRIEFFQKGLPRPDGKHGNVHVEGLFNFHDGWLYASGGNGSLYRLDPHTADATHLFTPIPDRPSRLTSLALAADGCAYGVTGKKGKCELLRFDFKAGKYELLGPIVDQDGEPCWQVHDICLTKDGVLYACENDNPLRSSYLWEIRLD